MCSLPECDVPAAERIVRSIEGATKQRVGLFMCPKCDTRRCDGCRRQVASPYATHCPNCGSALMRPPKFKSDAA